MAQQKIKKIKGGVVAPKGFLAGGIHCGIKSTRRDLALIFSETPAVAAAVFTLNQVHAAPVKVSREKVKNLKAQAIIAASGCANACTGARGIQDAKQMAQTTAKKLGIGVGEVLVASTGPIGTYLPMGKVKKGIQHLVPKISKHGNEDAAAGILTTDLVVKTIAVSFNLAGKEVRIGAMAKGSGMIRPNMGTMFCFITTDASVDKNYFRSLLKKCNEKTFNRIDVDGDTSTNDTVIALANGLAGNKKLTGKETECKLFEKAFELVCFEMAKAIVLDGEGATKLVQIEVCGAKTEPEAKRVSESVANSKLVKTSFYGAVPGWGRILAAIGYSGARVDENKIDIYLGSKKVIEKGIKKSVNKKEVQRVLKSKNLNIKIDLNLGKEKSQILTCDLSHKYIDINV